LSFLLVSAFPEITNEDVRLDLYFISSNPLSSLIFSSKEQKVCILWPVYGRAA
jgi:hypothetical protein